MQAIITKYISPTNTRSARIKASCERGSLIISWNHGAGIDQNHIEACDALCEQFEAEDAKNYPGRKRKDGWTRPKAHGQLPSGEFAHVFIDREGGK